ncbi:MAG: hypothetical protein P8Y54_14230 [Xanthomonadales bacterium]
MRNERPVTSSALRRLIRFLMAYGLVLSALFWLLPSAALYLQGVYDALDTRARFALISGLLVVAVAWQLGAYRIRSREQGSRSHGARGSAERS